MRRLAAVAAVAAMGAQAGAAVVLVERPDSATIGAALGRARAGDAVRLAAGAWSITEPISLPSGVRLEGAGRGATTVRWAGTTRRHMVVIENADGAAVADLTLDGDGSGRVIAGIQAWNSRRLRIERVGIRDLAKGEDEGVHAIHFVGDAPGKTRGVTDSVIRDCVIERIGRGAAFGCGIRLSWGCSRNRVTGCLIAETGRGGIFADNGSHDLVISGNRVSRSGGEKLGIEVWGGCDRCVIEDNVIDHWLSIGGCDACAVRRNVVSARDGSFAFIGIEVIGSRCVLTDNRVDDGQVIGLSVSNTSAKEHVYYGRCTFRRCSQWGAQLQGESGGIARQYLYRCRFEDTTADRGVVIYPTDCGDGFRVNGNTRQMTFDACVFAGNARSGLQNTTADSGEWLFRGCRFERNGGPAMMGAAPTAALEMPHTTAAANGDDRLPGRRPFAGAAPSAAIRVETPAADRRAGASLRFSAGLSAEALWDFGDGPPGWGASAKHTYARPGRYEVTLIVWDRAGRAARATTTIRVR